MNTVVVYDSQYGNIEQVARAIGTHLETLGPVRLVSVNDSAGVDLGSVDLLVIGGPTQAHGASRPLRTWIDWMPTVVMQGLAAATFDTRFRWPTFLSGSAARSVAKTLQRNGVRLVAPPESFFVGGTEGPLADGELERAGSWAETLVLKLAGGAVPTDPVHSASS